MMSFQFVDNNSAHTAPTRKLIRSHVMRGKNLGKSISASAKFKTLQKNTINHKLKTEGTSFPEKLMPLTPNVGHGLSSLSFPCDLQPYMRDLIQQFTSIGSKAAYPTELCLSFTSKHSFFLEHLIADEAFFHCVLAMSELSIAHLSGSLETSPRALYHLTMTYRLIKQNLQDNELPSNATVASVMSMAIHEDIRGQFEESRIHVDALQQMVNLRGGLEQFYDVPFLAYKICRADIECSLRFGFTTRFYCDRYPRDLVRALLEKVPREQQEEKHFAERFIQNPDLRAVMIDMLEISTLLNYNSSSFKFEPMTFSELLLSVFYRLLNVQGFADRHGGLLNVEERICQLTLLAFLTTVLFKAHRLPYTLLSTELRQLLQNLSNRVEDNERLLLWCLFVAGISVFSDRDSPWLKGSIKAVARTLKVDSWNIVRRRFKSFPWLDSIHDQPAQTLWQSAIWY